MKLSAIKIHAWVETKMGIGQVQRVGGTFPPSVRVLITKPFPRGVVSVSPRDIVRELDPSEVPS